MGHRVTQRILECDVCHTIPDDGQHLWEMCGEYWCETCCEQEENLEEEEEEELPEFEGTKDKLDNLSIFKEGEQNNDYFKRK